MLELYKTTIKQLIAETKTFLTLDEPDILRKWIESQDFSIKTMDELIDIFLDEEIPAYIFAGDTESRKKFVKSMPSDDAPRFILILLNFFYRIEEILDSRKTLNQQTNRFDLELIYALGLVFHRGLPGKKLYWTLPGRSPFRREGYSAND